MKNYVIGDIHGNYFSLINLLNKLPMQNYDKLIFIGDYIDRGPHSKRVVEFVKELQESGQAVALMGNHEKMCLDSYRGSGYWGQVWMRNGGGKTIDSYDTRTKEEKKQPSFADEDYEEKYDIWMSRLPEVSKEHLDWMESLKLSYEVDGYFICHAGIDPEVELEYQSEDDLLWIRNEFITYALPLPKKVVFGHTPFEKPQILSNKIGIDTGCVYGNKLSAYCLETAEVFSVEQDDRDEK